MEQNKQSRMWWVRICLSGLVLIAPFFGTVWIVVFLCKLLMQFGKLLAGFLGIDHEMFPEAVYLILPIVLLVLLGFAVLTPIGRKIQRALEQICMRLPLVRFIYNSLGQFVAAIRGLGNERKFKSVVYVDYPSEGCRLLGFVTGEYFDQEKQQQVTSVFVPTSPNPLTGFMLLIDEDKVRPCSMTVQEASKMVLSAGLVTPQYEHSGEPSASE